MIINDIAIVGAGGLGREILFQLWEMNKVKMQYNILGFYDDNSDLIGQNINGLPVLGSISNLTNYDKFIDVAVCIANPKIRRSVAEKLSRNPKISYPNIFAPDFRCSDFVSFGKGCIVCFSNIITIDVHIGDFVIISNSCTIGHDSVLNEYATVYNSVNISGSVKIGSCSEIGTGTKIIQGKSIGNNSILGAGSIVVTDIPQACTAVGIPAKPIKYHTLQQ